MRRALQAAAAGLAIVAVPVSLALALSGAPADSGLDVALHEDRIEVGERSVTAGTIELRTTNSGREEHELLIVATDLPADRIPLGIEGPAVQLAGRVVYGEPHAHDHAQAGRRGLFDHLQPGRTRRDRVELAAGRYVLLCTLPGHYQAGQRAALRVTAPSTGQTAVVR